MLRDSISRLGARRSGGLLLASAAVFFVLLTYISLYAPNASRVAQAIAQKTAPGLRQPFGQSVMPAAAKKEPSIRERLEAAASNRTLGFESIQFVNLPHRHDRFDAAFLQAHVSGLKLSRFPAVIASELRDVGLPPTEKPERLNVREKGCYRAHANVWQHMLEHDIPALLVLESDAAWDEGIRDSMRRLNGGFRDVLREANPRAHVPDDPADPWAARTGLWDMITLGHCVDSYKDGQPYYVFEDPHAGDQPHELSDSLEPMGARQRVVFRAHGMACTTAYAVSLRGAAKLLLRMAWNLEEPIDLVMGMMASAGELQLYSVRKRLVTQWAYKQGIGMGQRGANSDIHNGPQDDGSSSGWDEAKRSHSVWTHKDGYYKDTDFRDMALDVAWKRIIEAPPPPPAPEQNKR